MKWGRRAPSPSTSDAAAALALVLTATAAVGVVGWKAARGSGALELITTRLAAPAAETPPAVGAPAQALPALEAPAPVASAPSPLPFAGDELRKVDQSVSRSFTPAPELAKPDDLEAVSPAGGAAPDKPAWRPQAHLKPMGSVAGYLDGAPSKSVAFYNVDGKPAAGGGDASAPDQPPLKQQEQMAAMVAALNRAVAAQPAAAPNAAVRVKARARTTGAVQNPGKIYYGTEPTAQTTIGRGDQRSTLPTAAGPSVAPVRAAPMIQSIRAGSGLDGFVSQFASRSGKSVIMYLSPWCHFCHSGLPVIRAMRSTLRAQGIDAKIVVGGDSEGNLARFASEIGGDVTIDSANNNPLHGVPAFVVAQNGQATATHLGTFDSEAEGRAWALSH